jgi:hypothetical protein
MSSRFLTILLFLVLAAAVTACEPAPAIPNIDPEAEIQTAVQEIATAIADQGETPIPELSTPTPEATDAGNGGDSTAGYMDSHSNTYTGSNGNADRSTHPNADRSTCSYTDCNTN